MKGDFRTLGGEVTAVHGQQDEVGLGRGGAQNGLDHLRAVRVVPVRDGQPRALGLLHHDAQRFVRGWVRSVHRIVLQKMQTNSFKPRR